MRAFKFVDQPFAEAFERGVFRIGTLRGYGAMEGARRDDAEGALYRKIHNGRFDHNSHGDLQRMRDFGVVFDNLAGVPLEITMTNTTFGLRHPDAYCFCMSRSVNNGQFSSEEQAMFEVLAIKTIASIIQSTYPDKLSADYKTSSVSYSDRTVNWRDTTTQPNPFCKDTRFRDEAEVRIVWAAMDSPPKPFNTDPDLRLAGLVRRIRN